MIKSISKNAIILSIFTVISTSIMSIIHYLTKSTVEYQIALQNKHLLEEVIPATLYNNSIQKECYLIQDKNVLGNKRFHHLYVARKDDQPVAAALETIAPDGYSGDIKMLVGADFYGKVLGVRVIDAHETPGLGDKIDIRISDWIINFKNKVVHGNNDKYFAIKKDGGEFEQFTGATITPRAVVNATKRTVLLIKKLSTRFSSLPKCGKENE